MIVLYCIRQLVFESYGDFRTLQQHFHHILVVSLLSDETELSQVGTDLPQIIYKINYILLYFIVYFELFIVTWSLTIHDVFGGNGLIFAHVW